MYWGDHSKKCRYLPTRYVVKISINVLKCAHLLIIVNR
jgi:hypothetical protein